MKRLWPKLFDKISATQQSIMEDTRPGTALERTEYHRYEGMALGPEGLRAREAEGYFWRAYSSLIEIDNN